MEYLLAILEYPSGRDLLFVLLLGGLIGYLIGIFTHPIKVVENTEGIEKVLDVWKENELSKIGSGYKPE